MQRGNKLSESACLSGRQGFTGIYDLQDGTLEMEMVFYVEKGFLF
mgnify:CR=1 FL=1